MPSHRPDRDDSADEARDPKFRAIVERYDGAPNQCTIMPADSERTDQTTVWITAKSPAFVDLREHR